MKRFLSLLLFLGCLQTVCLAQSQTIYMFDDFIKVKIQFKNKTKGQVMANYDAGQKRLMMRQNDMVFESTNTATIDTIFFGERRFIPAHKGLMEVVKVPHGSVKIDWWLRDVNIGSKGALGSVTQGHVQHLQLSTLGLNATEMYTGYQNSRENSNEVYRRKNRNNYFIEVGGREYKLQEMKHLYKAFPDKAEKIKAYAAENKLDLRTADNALKMLDYVLGL